MARNRGIVCRMCRAEGEKLFLKGERCYSNKCAIERREGGPGQHARRGRQRLSEFKGQLREKQKVKRLYGVLEKQFRKYYDEAASSKGVTGTEMLISLERRLDNMVYKAGFACSRAQARQRVRHGQVTVNGQKVDIPSYQVAVNDVMEVAEKFKNLGEVQASMASAEGRLVPEWIKLDRAAAKATLVALPNREQMTHPIKEQLIVELYNR